MLSAPPAPPKGEGFIVARCYHLTKKQCVEAPRLFGIPFFGKEGNVCVSQADACGVVV